ncbi:uncharacterized protein LOC116853723 [Odontomachus brunneus]|uniref:uncharacterized protein LOC116853723 n=1 Tax=Odontomachus brunneus TaxID=486640 RepID=UPI0013F1A03C|nr:uncharacterized protein LOC116853723 [Odontomachus brunneus]XP_032690788.1 uncharacterized protein LOC116853723 [Odontomachus brunneus]XP_032690789.1 uncharacterized protein LOC116853723 [Odontomachus brunneus]
MDEISNKNIIAFIATMLMEIINEDESSDSDSDVDIIQNLLIQPRVPTIKIKNYVENIVSLYSEVEFKIHFRMTRTTFIFLLELLTSHLNKYSNTFGRQPISPEKQLLMSIWMMASPNSYRWGISYEVIKLKKIFSPIMFKLGAFVALLGGNIW